MIYFVTTGIGLGWGQSTLCYCQNPILTKLTQLKSIQLGLSLDIVVTFNQTPQQTLKQILDQLERELRFNTDTHQTNLIELTYLARPIYPDLISKPI